MGLLELVSRQNKSEKSVSQQLSTDVHISSDQGGHWKDINHARGHPLLYTSANSCDFLRCVGNQKSRESADMQEFLVPRSTEEHRAILTQRLSTWSHQLPASNLYTECMGQNFTDEGSQNDSNNEPRAKRMKAALTGDPGNDQIVPSGKYPVSDNRTIHG